MFDPILLLKSLVTIVLPLTLFIYLLVKFIVLPPLIQKIVRDIPLDKDIAFDNVTIERFHDDGLDMSVHATVLGTKPAISIPRSLFWIRLQIDSRITCLDAALQDLLCEISLSDPLVLTLDTNVKINQSCITVHLADSKETIRNLVKRVMIAGIKELDRMVLFVRFTATIQLGGFMTLNGLTLEKEIPVQPLRERQQKNFKEHLEALDKLRTTSTGNQADTEAMSRSSSSSLTVINKDDEESPSSTASSVDLSSLDTGVLLIPAPSIQPLPVAPALRTILGGLHIEYPFPPRLNMSLGVLRFAVTLNSSIVARGSITGLHFTPDSKEMRVLLEVIPSVVSSKPIRGLATTAKGVLKGAFTGAMNGLLYGDWGSGATVIGITELSLETSHSEPRITPEWLKSILDSIEIEHDINAVKRFGSRAKKVTRDVSEGMMVMAAGVVEVAGKHGSKCVVM